MNLNQMAENWNGLVTKLCNWTINRLESVADKGDVKSTQTRLSAAISQTPQVRGAGRSNTMKSSNKDRAEGKFHKVKGKLREIAGKLSMKPQLEAEGKDEKIAGKVQEKIGQVENVLGK